MDMIIFKDVVVLRNDLPVLNNLSLTVSNGITFCYASPESGKTTFCETAMGLVSPKKGTVEKQCKTAIAARSADLLSRSTITNNIKMLQTLHNSQIDVLEIIKIFGLEQVSGAHFSKLTVLQKSLARLACAVATGAELIICDDLDSGFNTQSKQKLYNTILMLNHKYSISFLIVSGDNAAAAFADRQLILSDGIITEVHI